jgi:hypothetical protein
MATPTGSVAATDGSIHVSYSDGTEKTLPAAQAQQLGLLPSQLNKTATASTAVGGGFGTAGGYGNPAGAFPSTAGSVIYDPNTGVQQSAAGSIPLKVNGQIVPTSIGELISQSRLPQNLAQIRSSLVKGALISKTEKNPTRIQNAWIQVLLGAQQSQMDPNDYLASLKAQGFGQNAPLTQTKVTDYSKVADGYFYQAFKSVFNRMPTAADMQSPIRGANGKMMTWQQALIAEANKPQNAEVTVTKVNPDGSISNQVSTPGFDPNVWLTQQLTNTYTDAIKSGVEQPTASAEEQYSQLAAEYGINAFDPNTQKLTPQAQIDLANLSTGKKTIDDFKVGWSNQVAPKVAATAQQPLLSGAVTLKDVAKPAIDTVANLLEVNPATITLDNPYVQKYIQGDGKSTMSQAELQSMVKSDPSWKFTQNANASLTDLASQILGKFGVNA